MPRRITAMKRVNKNARRMTITERPRPSESVMGGVGKAVGEAKRGEGETIKPGVKDGTGEDVTKGIDGVTAAWV